MPNIDEIRNFVTEGYRNILKRDPDESGLNHHVGLISSGRLTREKFLEALRLCEEYRNRHIIAEEISKCTDIRYITVVNNLDVFNRNLSQSLGINKDNINIIDNIFENRPISQRYNEMIRQLLKDPKQEWLAFCHQDFYIGEDLSKRLYNLNKNCIYGPIGMSYSTIALGKIIEINYPVGKECDGCVIDTLDAMCMIVYKDTIKKYNLLFDERFRFHFYVEDFCAQISTIGIPTKTLQMICRHMSAGNTNSSDFINARDNLIRKWGIIWTTTGIHKT